MAQHDHEIAEAEGLAVVPPFDHPAIIAGQGTIGLEILEQLPDLNEVVVPVGGGGLIAGVATAIKETKPGAIVTGVQASGANAAVLSLKQGRLGSIERASTGSVSNNRGSSAFGSSKIGSTGWSRWMTTRSPPPCWP